MGPASHPATVLILLLASLMPTSGAWEGPHSFRRSDVPITAAAVAHHASSLALEGAYFLGSSRLKIHFGVDARTIALATLAVGAEALGIRVGIQHDAAGFALSFDASGLSRSFTGLRLFSLFRISA
jgi:hypothetical protein